MTQRRYGEAKAQAIEAPLPEAREIYIAICNRIAELLCEMGAAVQAETRFLTIPASCYPQRWWVFLLVEI